MNYTTARVAVDPVVFTIHNRTLKVLLVQREKDPFKGAYELPGGLLQGNETAEETLARKLQELAGKSVFFTQFYTFSDPKRDARERTISIGFISLTHELSVAQHYSWHDYQKLPKLAFDHQKIILKARFYLKEHADELVRHFMPKLFPLNKLQEVYELIEEKSYDNRNFRKQMITSGLVEETKYLERDVSHRPAKLFKFLS